MDYCHISSHFFAVLYVCESSIYLYWRRKRNFSYRIIRILIPVPYIPVRYSNSKFETKNFGEHWHAELQHPGADVAGRPQVHRRARQIHRQVHASQRRAALFDYWIGRVTSFLLILATYYTGSYFFVADAPPGKSSGAPSSSTSPEAYEEPFTMFDHQWNTTRYFHGFFLAAVIFLWLLVLKGDFVEDSRLLRLPNALPPRLPFLAHGQVFWRDYLRSSAIRAWHRLETITMSAQATPDDYGLTRYWLRPWGRNRLRHESWSPTPAFHAGRFSEFYVGGHACNCGLASGHAALVTLFSQYENY